MALSAVPSTPVKGVDSCTSQAADQALAMLELSIETEVVPGVIGSARFSYDLWADTVTITSCMDNT